MICDLESVSHERRLPALKRELIEKETFTRLFAARFAQDAKNSKIVFFTSLLPYNRIGRDTAV